MSDLHHEKHLEAYVVEKLTEQGWLLGDIKGFNQDTAVYTEDVEAWIKQTQGSKWDKLVALNGARAGETLLSRLDAALAKHGTIQVLRRGFSIAGWILDLRPEIVALSWQRKSCTQYSISKSLNKYPANIAPMVRIIRGNNIVGGDS